MNTSIHMNYGSADISLSRLWEHLDELDPSNTYTLSLRESGGEAVVFLDRSTLEKLGEVINNRLNLIKEAESAERAYELYAEAQWDKWLEQEKA